MQLNEKNNKYLYFPTAFSSLPGLKGLKRLKKIDRYVSVSSVLIEEIEKD